MGKRLAAVGMAAAIGVGGLTVAAVNPLGVAGAQDPAPSGSAASEPAKAGPLQRALDGLVADGTLTQEQADAVVAATKAEAEAGRAEHKERAQARCTATLAVVAEALGSTPDEVKAALKDGTSIAAQAEAAGVERQVVDDALTEHLGEYVPAERLDQAVDRIIDADGSFRERFKERRGN